MVKVLLISISSDIHSFGARCLSAYLKKYGDDICEVKHLFLTLNIDELLKTVNLKIFQEFIKDNFDLIGISLMSSDFIKAKKLTEIIKNVSNAPIIWGGIHPTVFPEECLKHCDIVCIGEGEEILLGIIRKMSAHHDYLDGKNIGFMRDGKVIQNELQKPVEDLDTIPPLDFDSKSNYVLLEGKIKNMTNDILESFIGSFFMTMTSRGCLYKCAYCCNNARSNISHDYNKVRRQSPQRVIDDLVTFKRELKFIKYIIFDDDDFLSTKIENLKLFSMLYKEKINLPFYITGLLPTSVTEEKLQMLIDAGLNTIRLGIQSASERINKELYNRPTQISKLRKSIEVINKFKKDIKLPRYDIILDNPWETDDEKIVTVRFLNDLPRPFVINKFSLTFYPGTALFKKAIAENIISNIEEEVYEKKFKRADNTLLNFLVYVISLTKIPKIILAVLLLMNKIKFLKRVPLSLFALLDSLDVIKRNIFLLHNRSFKSFINAVKYSLKQR